MYKLIRLIGKGEKSEVWLADRIAGGQVAVKFRPRDSGEKLAELELAGLDCIRNLRHPNLLQIHGFFKDQKGSYFIWELADRTLLDYVEEARDKKIPLARQHLTAFIHQTANCLDFLHENNLVHGWVKPQHILLFGQIPKLSDFTLTHPTDGRAPDMLKVCVKPPYLPPECQEGRTSIHSDQYALASTYACLRSNNSDFCSEPSVSLIGAFPKKEQEVILKAWSKNPNNRFPTCLDFATQLEQASGDN
jgi:serine/threonine protein kinase